MGATKQLVCGVWFGYDTPKELYGSSGGRWSAPAWQRFMEQATDIWKQHNKVEKLVEDARATARQRNLARQYKEYVKVRICNQSGLLATRNCPSTHVETFSAAGGAPTQYCDLHKPKNSTPDDDDDNHPNDAAVDSGSDTQPPPATPADLPDDSVPARRQNFERPVPPGDGRDDATMPQPE
jgi:membrane carboxypeptidase/penicillin-binding protein